MFTCADIQSQSFCDMPHQGGRTPDAKRSPSLKFKHIVFNECKHTGGSNRELFKILPRHEHHFKIWYYIYILFPSNLIWSDQYSLLIWPCATRYTHRAALLSEVIQNWARVYIMCASGVRSRDATLSFSPVCDPLPSENLTLSSPAAGMRSRMQ